MIVVLEEDQGDKSVQFQPKLSELLLLPELEEDNSLFDRNKETGRDVTYPWGKPTRASYFSDT